MTFAIIMCCVYFIVWIYLLWEIVKTATKVKEKGVEGVEIGWIVLCALGSSVSAFICGVTLMRIFELL